MGRLRLAVQQLPWRLGGTIAPGWKAQVDLYAF